MLIEKYNPLEGEMLQILDKDGRVDKKLEPKLSSKDLEKIYYTMVLTRLADDKALKLQRQGRMGTFASSKGHEASQVGSAFAMHKEDWMFPYFRDLGALLIRGMPLENYYLYWMGNEEGLRLPQGINNFTIAIPVATQILHAVGAAWGAKIKGDKIAVAVYFGDGATSEGDFHEGMNFAGVFKTPTVFICQNNQYAISVPRERQTASKTLAQKALAYGFDGILVDGNDVLAIYSATKEALEKARKGGGPTFIESYTYRIGDHTTSDDATRYRREEEVKKWEEKDPIKRFKIYLQRKGIWTKEFEEKLVKKAEKGIEEGIKKAEPVPRPAPEDIFKYTYSTMPLKLEEQLKYLLETQKGKGGG